MSILSYEASIASSSQFAGTEFNVTALQTSRAGYVLKGYEICLHMGSESKTFTISKHTAGTSYVIYSQSASTVTDVVLVDPALVGVTLLSGEYISITTSGATAAMVAKVYLIEVPSETSIQLMRLV
jgi:hypothetical protein